MTTDTPPTTRPTMWLVIAGILSVISIAALWPLQYVGQICTLQYPPPPGCFAEEPRWVPLVAIGLVIALAAAAVVVFFTVPSARTALVLLSAGIVVVVFIAAAVVWLSQTGIWDPHQPPVIID